MDKEGFAGQKKRYRFGGARAEGLESKMNGGGKKSICLLADLPSPSPSLLGHALHLELRRLGHTGIHSSLTTESLTQQMELSWRKPVRAVNIGKGISGNEMSTCGTRTDGRIVVQGGGDLDNKANMPDRGTGRGNQSRWDKKE